MAKSPDETRHLRTKRREEHDNFPPHSDDGVEMSPIDGRAVLGDLHLRPIAPPPFKPRHDISKEEAAEKERTSTPDDSPSPRDLPHTEISVSPTSDEASPKAVFAKDDRVLITPTNGFPNRAICHLIVTFPLTSPGWASWGTGTLISSKHVLTAGHVLYSALEGGWATTIRVIPGQDGAMWWYGSELLTWPNFKQRSVTGWTVDGDIGYDYGLITLNKGFSVGSFGLMYLSDDQLDKTTAYLCGYPGDRPKNSANQGQQQYAVPQGGALTDYDSELVYYAMDTWHGQSGSGVYSFKNGKRGIFAVHHGQYDSDENCGARITKARHDLIRGWQQADA